MLPYICLASASVRCLCYLLFCHHEQRECLGRATTRRSLVSRGAFSKRGSRMPALSQPIAQLIVLSYCISWLGAYTSTQIIIHAKYTNTVPSKWLWTFLASVAFGFSAIWSMHFGECTTYGPPPYPLNLPFLPPGIPVCTDSRYAGLPPGRGHNFQHFINSTLCCCRRDFHFRVDI